VHAHALRTTHNAYGTNVWCHQHRADVAAALQDLVRVNAQHRVLLTGTPLQNSLEELFYLMNFLEPDKFANVEQFKAAYASLDDKDKVWAKGLTVCHLVTGGWSWGDTGVQCACRGVAWGVVACWQGCPKRTTHRFLPQDVSKLHQQLALHMLLSYLWL
jgi:hypothetical protein